MASSRRIDYRVRPAKCVERKMLCEAFQRLRVFAPVESYRYVAFGSYYFRDFVLFHKSLGITDMIAIERDTFNRTRYDFNRPFACIRMKYGTSSDVLPQLNWDKRTIVWLDYEDPLDISMLGDIKFVTNAIVPTSVVIITCNAEAQERKLEDLELEFGNRLPTGLKEGDLKGWGAASVYRKIIDNEILVTVSDRNGGLPDHERYKYHQLFYFQYADGAKMLTVGGILLKDDEEALQKLGLVRSLPFVRTDAQPFQIKVPNLTFRELQYLERHMPCDDFARLGHLGIPQPDLELYSQHYRYFPVFAEMEL